MLQNEREAKREKEAKAKQQQMGVEGGTQQEGLCLAFKRPWVLILRTVQNTVQRDWGFGSACTVSGHSGHQA